MYTNYNLDLANPEIEPSMQRLSIINQLPLMTLLAASSAPSCFISLQRSSTQTDLTPLDSSQPSNITSKESSPDSRIDLIIRDLPLLFSREIVGQSRENFQARLDRYHLR